MAHEIFNEEVASRNERIQDLSVLALNGSICEVRGRGVELGRKS
jgi:hypothetical protein